MSRFILSLAVLATVCFGSCTSSSENKSVDLATKDDVSNQKTQTSIRFAWPTDLAAEVEMRFSFSSKTDSGNMIDQANLSYQFRTEPEGDRIVERNDQFKWILEPQWHNFPPTLRPYLNRVFVATMMVSTVYSADGKVDGVRGIEENRRQLAPIIKKTKRLDNVDTARVNEMIEQAIDERKALDSEKMAFQETLGLVLQRPLTLSEPVRIACAEPIPTLSEGPVPCERTILLQSLEPCQRGAKRTQCAAIKIEKLFSAEAVKPLMAKAFTESLKQTKGRTKNATNFIDATNYVEETLLVVEQDTAILHKRSRTTRYGVVLNLPTGRRTEIKTEIEYAQQYRYR